MNGFAAAERIRYAHAVAVLGDMRRAGHIAQMARGLVLQKQPAGRIVAGSDSGVARARVGLLSGSFNPLTRAHVALAEAARAAGNLDGVLWALSLVTVEKEYVERASVVDRALQMEALVGTGPDACALINRGLYVDLARVARDMLPDLDDLIIIIGFDKIVQILDPRYYDDRNRALAELFELASFLVAPRAGEGASSLRALMRRDSNQRYAARVAYCPLPRRYHSDSSSLARVERASMAQPGGLRSLQRLLAPEGLALADLPDVYATEAASEMGIERPDAYEARQREIERVRAAEVDDIAQPEED